MIKYITRFFSAEFDGKKISHNIALFAVILVCVFICFSAYPNIEDNVEYPLDRVEGKSWWVQQFDAFEKGQLHLDIPVDPALEALENPYDPAQRVGVRYPWDRAYFEGKYYSYFGIAPILTVYYPFYAITGELPSSEFACLILGALAMLFLGLAYREFLIRFCRGASLWLALLLLFGVAFSSGIFVGLCWSDAYYVAVLSAISWSMAFVFLALFALRAKKTVTRSILLALSAAALTMTVWSRPTVAVLCLFVLPLFAEYLIRGKKEDLKDKIISASSFCTVLLCGAAAVMVYNAARFGSPLDFGSNYQLTVSDISKNKLDISMLADSVYHFFFRQAEFKSEFPFFFARFVCPDYGEKYFYAASTVGAFAFGVPFAALASPFTDKIKKDPARTVTAALALALCAGVAFFDYCYAGLDMRYIIDVLPLLSLFGAAALLGLHKLIREKTESFLYSGAFSCFALVLCALAVLTAVGLTGENPESHIFPLTK